MSSDGVRVSLRTKQQLGMTMSPNKKPPTAFENERLHRVIASEFEKIEGKIKKLMNDDDSEVFQSMPSEEERRPYHGMEMSPASEVIFNDSEALYSRILMNEMYLADNNLRQAFIAVKTKAEIRFGEILNEAKHHLEELKAIETDCGKGEAAEEMNCLCKKFIDKYRQLTFSCLIAEERVLNSSINKWAQTNCDILERAEINHESFKNRFSATEIHNRNSKSENFFLKLVIFAAVVSNVTYGFIFRRSPFDFLQVQPMVYFDYLKEQFGILFNLYNNF